jgi:5,10-methylene-tetrahydrofolate dehydrogenase/methenyl tetrahydrofolate cyclohydrolase
MGHRGIDIIEGWASNREGVVSQPTLMYGKPVAEQITARIERELPEFKARYKVTPTLAIVQVGDDPPSTRYVGKKIEACERLGMAARRVPFSADIDADGLRDEVRRLSANADIHGVLVQLPLPREIEEHDSAGTNKFDIFDAIDPNKDVDGIGSVSVTELYRAQQERMHFLAATALAVRRMISYYRVATRGKRAVIVGRNDITAKPIMQMMGGRMLDAAAIWCHRHVPQEEQYKFIKSADILVTSVGSSHYKIEAGMLKPGVVVFDIATRVTAAGKLVGDVDFRSVVDKASKITPVPGGVGPVTVAALTENLLRAAQFCCGAGKLGYEF